MKCLTVGAGPGSDSQRGRDWTIWRAGLQRERYCRRRERTRGFALRKRLSAIVLGGTDQAARLVCSLIMRTARQNHERSGSSSAVLLGGSQERSLIFATNCDYSPSKNCSSVLLFSAATHAAQECPRLQTTIYMAENKRVNIPGLNAGRRPGITRLTYIMKAHFSAVRIKGRIYDLH